MSRLENFKNWIRFNSEITGITISLIFFIVVYLYFTNYSRKIDFKDFTEKVELVDLEYEKIYSLPGFYSTDKTLDKIEFKLLYNYKKAEFESSSILFKEYICPDLERIIDNKDLEKLEVMCKKDSPRQSIVKQKLIKN